MRSVFLDGARQDLKDLRDYVIRSKPAGTWQKIKQQIQEKIRFIEDYPLAGSCPPELQDLTPRLRQQLTIQQRIIYEVRPDAVYIYAVCGQAQDLEILLTRRLAVY